MKDLRQEDGSVLVEVALILPVLVVILIGAVDYGLLLQRQLRVQQAASIGAGYVRLPANTNNLNGAQQAALNSISDLAGAQTSAQRYWTCFPGGARVSSSTTCSGSQPMQWVQISVSAFASAPFNFPGLPTNSSLQTVIVERVQWMP